MEMITAVKNDNMLPQMSFMVEPKSVSFSLPANLTKLIGRTSELAELTEILQEARLLTLLGPGGIGKTRLALDLARQVGSHFRDGALFVPLAPYRKADFVPRAIAAALSLSFYGAETEESQLLQYLQHKEIFLILDNMEQLLPDASGFVATLLEQAPGVTIVTTSRAALSLYGEWIYPLSGLSVPNNIRTPGAIEHDAIQLFSSSARRNNIHFQLNDENLADVITICQLLQGLPLAIELAAAWSCTLGCAEIASQIKISIDFLQINWINLPERHRSLRAVCKHSYELLSAQEQSAFAKLSIFAASFDLDAAQNVADVSAPLIQMLLNKSLVQQDAQDTFSLHPTVHPYAVEELATHVDCTQKIQQRHCGYYMRLLQAHSRQVFGTNHVSALVALTAAMDNIRQAWHFALQANKMTTIASAIKGLSSYYLAVGTYLEAREMFTPAAAIFQQNDNDDSSSLLNGHLLVEQARFLAAISEYDQALGVAEAALKAGEQLDSTALLAAANLQVGEVLWRQGEIEQARATLAEAQRAAKIAKLAKIEAWALCEMGTTYYLQGAALPATEHYARALTLFEQIDNQYGIANTVTGLGNIAAQQGDYALARIQYEKALALYRLLSIAHGTGVLLSNLGDCYASEGLLSQALAYTQEALEIHQRMNDRQSLAIVFNNLADISARLGLLENAQKYLDQALNLYQQIGDRFGESIALNNLAHLAHIQESFAEAEVYAKRSLLIVEEVEDRVGAGYTQTNLGRSLAAQTKFIEAETALNEALLIRREMGHTYLEIETKAALIQLKLAQDQPKQAAKLAMEIVEYVSARTLEGTEDPIQIYFSCYQALCIDDVPRAQQMLQAALEHLYCQIAKIDDPALRQSIIQNIPIHLCLLQLTKQIPTLAAKSNELLRELMPSTRSVLCEQPQTDEERAFYEEIEDEIRLLFRHKTLQKSTHLANSFLWDLDCFRLLLAEVDSTNEKAKASVLRRSLFNLITDELRPLTPLMTNIQTLSEEWITYLILYKSYVEDKTRVEVIREIERETTVRLSAGRAYARHLDQGRKKLTDLIWQHECKINTRNQNMTQDHSNNE